MDEAIAWRVRIARLLGEGVMLQVVGNPVNRAPLAGHRAQNEQRRLHRAGSLEAVVSKEAVVTDRYAEAGEQEADPEQDQADRRYVTLKGERERS